MVAVLQSYFDDSQTDGRLWIVGGFAGYPNQWTFFEELWAALLAKHGVPYFHMREMGKPHGAFAKWHPPEDHQEELIAFFTDIVAAIQRPNLQLFGSAVYIPDLDRFNRDYGSNIKPYPLAAYACITELGHAYPSIPTTAVFDRVEKIDDKLKTARAYVETDFVDVAGVVTSAPLAPGLNSRKVPPLQAADFVAWETRRTHTTLQPWFGLPTRPQGERAELWKQFEDWCRKTSGRRYPIQRKSFESLIGSGMRIKFIVWDYDQISEVHKARRGIWEAA